MKTRIVELNKEETQDLVNAIHTQISILKHYSKNHPENKPRIQRLKRLLKRMGEI